MGFFDALSDLVSAATPWTEHQAEAVSGGSAEEKTPANAGGKGEGEAIDEDAPTPDKKDMSGETVSGDDASGNDGDDAEEEDEELVDPKEQLENECKESKQCHSYKHHYDECVERVTSAESEGKPAKEDCVEEFFHLAHCATSCAAPKLWAALK